MNKRKPAYSHGYDARYEDDLVCQTLVHCAGPMDLSEIGIVDGSSRERARQVLETALTKLRRGLAEMGHEIPPELLERTLRTMSSTMPRRQVTPLLRKMVLEAHADGRWKSEIAYDLGVDPKLVARILREAKS